MKIALFDSINEQHVVDALAGALRELGHEVVCTGRVWSGFRGPRAPERGPIDAALEQVRRAGCDALLNLRACALARDDVARLRDAGLRTAVWLPDDPVLYASSYAARVDAYDVALHAGPGEVLRFYDARGHRAGVTFPFWLDPARWPARKPDEPGNGRLVFLGNLHGHVKKGRYERLVPAAGRIAIYGKCPADPAGLHRGELVGDDAIRAVVPLYTAGLDLPQRFADYAGSEHDFPGLAALGEFHLPSRILQYAALGIPVIRVTGAADAHFPHVRRVADVEGALDVLADPAGNALAATARRDVERHFSGMARARFLLSLFDGSFDPARAGLDARESAYRQYPGVPHVA